MAEAKQTASSAVGATETKSVSEFEKLLGERFALKTDEPDQAEQRKKSVSTAVQELSRQALLRSGTASIQGDVLTYIDSLIAKIDQDISRQLNAIMHHQDFTKLEGAWRGLHHLVSNTESDSELKIKVMNISKKDLYNTLNVNKGTLWDQGPLFKKIYEEEFGTPGGQPYGCLVGDFEFDHTIQDVQTLREISRIAAAAHCPFISAAGPKLLGMDSWQNLGDKRDLAKTFDTPDYAMWRSLRNSEDARFIGLALPRFLARAPYSTKSNPIDGFAFEEDASGTSHNNYVWANAAYAMAANITRAFKLHGWCANIRGPESGGMVENLPVHTFPSDDGGVDMKCPTEISITDRREAELAKLGFMPLSHWKNTDYAVFVGAQSLQKPAKFDDPDATANANLSARLPYLFATSRFAHFLKCMVRDKIGSGMERDELQLWLNNWIMGFVTDSGASNKAKAERPLAKAEVKVQDDPENPGYYRAQFFLRPHFQLEGVNISLRLVSRLPRDRAA